MLDAAANLILIASGNLVTKNKDLVHVGIKSLFSGTKFEISVLIGGQVLVSRETQIANTGSSFSTKHGQNVQTKKSAIASSVRGLVKQIP